MKRDDELPNRTKATDKDSIQVIARAAAVLRIVAEEPDGLSLAEISRRVGLARSTVQRIVKSLEDEVFLDALSIKGRYSIGRGLIALSRQPSIDVSEVAEPFLRELAMTVNETVDLSVLKGNRALFVANIAGSHRLSALSAVGTRFPLHSTANGKALLSLLPAEQRAMLMADPLSADTPKTITDRDELLNQINQVYRSGIAYDIEEHTEGVCAIGTAFVTVSGTPYAISIPVPRQRYFEKVSEFETPLLHCRSQIIAALSRNARPATSPPP